MYVLEIPATELYNEVTNEFITIRAQKLVLEHSLVSLSKWEQKWHKPFISKTPKTVEETLDYIKCMTITQNVKDETYLAINNDMMKAINAYIDDPMTATWFSDRDQKRSSEVITSELIYYWMIALNIPFECRKWHLNSLLTLVKVCSIKQTPKKKMSKNAILKNNRALNEARKASLGTTG